MSPRDMARRADYVHRVAMAAMTTEEREAHEAKHRRAEARGARVEVKAPSAPPPAPAIPPVDPFTGPRRGHDEEKGPGLAVTVPAKKGK